MINVVIIDDEPLARSIVTEYLKTETGYTVVSSCADGFEGIKSIQQYKPELIFLDIQMPRLNGFEMLELVDKMPVVIFTTAFDEYAIKAFEQHAIDYLLKPFSKERFLSALSKSSQRLDYSAESASNNNFTSSMTLLPSRHDRVVVKTGTKIQVIPIADIHYFEADDDYVSIHTAKDSYLKNRTLNYFEKLLDPDQFLRVHRSYLLKVQEITRIDPYLKDSYLAVLRSGAQIPVSRSGYSRLKDKLGI